MDEGAFSVLFFLLKDYIVLLKEHKLFFELFKLYIF